MILSYTLDQQDRIIDIGGDWDDFAIGNGGHSMVRQNVLGRPIWQYIQGMDTRSYLNAVMFVCRQHQCTIRAPYRCDSDSVARLHEMTVIPAGGALTLLHRGIANFRRIEDPGQTPAADRSVSHAICSVCLRSERAGNGISPGYMVCRTCKQTLNGRLAEAVHAEAGKHAVPHDGPARPDTLGRGTVGGGSVGPLPGYLDRGQPGFGRLYAGRNSTVLAAGVLQTGVMPADMARNSEAQPTPNGDNSMPAWACSAQQG